MMPQSIAYASLAGLPAQYGLYTAFIGSFTYVFFGTIKQVSIGPTSLMSLLTLSYTEGLNVDFVILLSLLAGIVEFLMGVLKLGFLVDFISPCVTSGFTSAMTVVLVASQLKFLLGLRKLNNHGCLDVIHKIFERRNEIKLADTSLGLACICFLYAFKQLPKIKTRNHVLKKTLWFLSISKNALVVLISTVVAYWYSQHGGGSPFNLSGAVPQGLPTIKVPSFSTSVGNETYGFTDMVATLGTSIVVLPLSAVVANVAIAKAFATGVIVDATQEMMTLGLCNIFGSFIQAMPSCGAFTRSAVANSSGVRTPLQGIYSGTIILLALSFLTPYFFYIPRATLAAVLITAVIPMFDCMIFPKLWRCNKFDFFLTLKTTVTGIVWGVEIGIIVGALMNLIILLKLWTRPTVITEIRTDRKGCQYISMTPELGLYYPAIDYLTVTISEAHNTSPHLPIVLNCANILKIDYAGCQTINNLVNTYNMNKIQMFSLAHVNKQVHQILESTIPLDNLRICQSEVDVNDSDDISEQTNDCGLDMPLIINHSDSHQNGQERKKSYFDDSV